MPSDAGWLIFNEIERDEIVRANPETSSLVKKYVGSSEFINATDRYCLWVEDKESSLAWSNPFIAERLEKVAEFRVSRNDKTTRDLALKPWRFKQAAYKPTNSIVVPSVSSERRPYIPMGFLGKESVVSNRAYVVYDADLWVFAVLTSRTHMTWTESVTGRLENRLSYSNTIVYNNFPVPPLSEALKEKLTIAALRVLDVREYHCEKTLAELYDPDLMPQDLRDAHAAVDVLVDSIYSKKPYETDEQRLSDLFALYEQMSAEEAAKAPLKKTRASRKAVVK